MKIALYVLFTILFTLPLVAQIEDDFERDDLQSGTIEWMGDLSNFRINDQKELQLNDIQAGESALLFQFDLMDSTEWELYFRMEFNPSSSNRLRIYLISEDSSLTESDAYFLDIGENGNDDPIYFVRRVDGMEEIMGTMELGGVAFDPALARIKIRHNGEDQWELQADYNGLTLFPDRLLIEVPPPDFQSAYFGFHCSYTATRADLFFFDNLKIGLPVADTSAPELLQLNATSPISLELSFDKLLDPTSAEVEDNFIVEGVGSPQTALFDSNLGNEVELIFEEEFENGQEYTLIISDVKDLNGNSTVIEETFTFILPEIPVHGDLVINEIHSLPSNTTLAPNLKFIELFNSSNKFLQIGDLKFSDRTQTVSLQEGILGPGEYLLLCDASDAELLEPFGRVMGLTGFPSINNTSDDIQLESQTDELLFAVSYRTSWFDDPLKADGGYSLELINPELKCQTGINYQLSEDISGATPGAANSILNLDFRPGFPEFMYGSYSDQGELGLHFNLELERISSSTPIKISINPDPGDFSLEYSPLNPKEFALIFENEPEEDRLYTIDIEGVRSCGNELNPGNIRYSFKKPALPEVGDLVINEILYSPPAGVRDFIELQNTTDDMYFRLSDLLFYQQRSNGNESNIRPTLDRIIAPEDLLTIGRETNLLKTAYHVENPFWLQDLDIAALDVNSGTVILSAFHPNNLVYLDSIKYSEELHDPLVRNTRAISLERTDPNLHPSLPAAWFSAATLVGGATPTAPNSQKRNVIEEEPDKVFFLNSRTFSPNGDGFEDFLQIEYRIDRPGYVANIKIFNMNGQLIRTLVQNQSLGTEGVILWAGENDRGERANVGIYPILIELHHIDGDRKKERLTAVLAERLN